MIDYYFNGKLTLFSVLCFVLFVSLGFWQLDREVEKRELLDRQKAMEEQPPMSSLALQTIDASNGLPVSLSGSYDPDGVMLLDNRVLDGVVGFEVLQLFYDESSITYLVNRGFVAMGRTRDVLPVIPAMITGPVTIKGLVYKPRDEQFQLADENVSFETLPVIVQSPPLARLEGVVKGDFYPHLIRLNEGEAGALPRYWPGTTMTPERHRGYAIQWFAMAVAVLLMWTYFSFRKRVSGNGDGESNHG